MGLPKNMFLRSQRHPIDDFLCDVCGEVLDDPVVLDPCQHTICKSFCGGGPVTSTSGQVECPVEQCKQEIIGQKEPPGLYVKMLNKLKFRCCPFDTVTEDHQSEPDPDHQYSRSGCWWKGNLAELVVHRKACEFNVHNSSVVCVKGCGGTDIEGDHNCMEYLNNQLGTAKFISKRSKDQLKRSLEQLKRSEGEVDTNKERAETAEKKLKMTEETLTTTQKDLKAMTEALELTKQELEATKAELQESRKRIPDKDPGTSPREVKEQFAHNEEAGDRDFNSDGHESDDDDEDTMLVEDAEKRSICPQRIVDMMHHSTDEDDDSGDSDADNGSSSTFEEESEGSFEEIDSDVMTDEEETDENE